MVSGVDIDSDNATIRASMQACSNRTQALGEHNICTAMKDAKWLGISLNRHSSN
jgi:hypothetical protein